jgi:uncharacterized protein
MTVSAIYRGEIVHTRTRPKRHKLRYRGFYLLLDLDELPALDRTLRLFACNRFGLFGFRDADHGDGSDQGLRQQVERQLERAGLAPDGGAIRVLCMPSVLGVVFNPLSVYFCHRADGSLSAVLYEVNNTFRQRHSYLIPVTDQSEPVVRQSCAKEFHVSPFMDLAMTYQFRVTPPADRVAVGVAVSDSGGPMLSAAFAGERVALSDGNLARAFLRHPLLAWQVLAGIHWEALKLWLKGVGLRPRPLPPTDPVSIVLEAKPR